MIDDVTFQNSNTRMKIVVDFQDPGSKAITSWTMVSFTYLVVSRFMNGGYSDIWATVASIDNPSDNTLVEIDQIASSYSLAAAPTGCETYLDPAINHGTTGCTTNAVDASGSQGGMHIVHAYIMGFRYNPSQSSTSYLHAGVLPGSLNVPRDNMEYTDSDIAAPGNTNIVSI